MSKSSIPTQGDFDRAKAAMAFRDRHWDDISTAARKKLSGAFDLHEFAIFPNDCDFEAILFLRTDEDVKQALGSAGEAKARQILIDAIRPFRAECAEIKIRVDFDSHENVTANFQGSYFYRLR